MWRNPPSVAHVILRTAPVFSLVFVATLQYGASAATVLDAQADPLTSGASRGFLSRVEAATWEEALITGNGRVGALVMGRPLDETITFSHERLFMPTGHQLLPPKMAPHLEAIRALIDAGRYRAAAELACQAARQEGYDEMVWTDPLVPALDLNMSLQPRGTPREYARSVDFRTGIATVRWEDDRGVILRRLFVSRADDVAVLALQSQSGAPLTGRVTLATTPQDDLWEELRGEEDEDDDEVPEAEQGEAENEDANRTLLGVDQVEIAADGAFLTYQSRFAQESLGGDRAHTGVVRVVAPGGSITTEGKAIVVEGADEVLLLVCLDVYEGEPSPTPQEAKDRLSKLEANFDELLRRHVAIHGQIFDRVRLDLGGGDDHRLPSEELLKRSQIGRMEPALLEKQFDASRYAILCATGELPPTLQGVWTGSWAPPWQSDYTQNGNVPAALASMMMANMPECIEAYFAYMETLLPHFRENARRLYDARGILVPSRTSTHGYNIHFDEEYIHLFWTTGAAWAAHFFYDYYLYTGDREFLAERAYPFMKEAALFYEDFLYTGPDGRYVFNPSYSPENTPTNSNSQASINATMDIALVKDLLSNLIAASKTLDADPGERQRWSTMLGKMPNYLINAEGALAEWTTPKLLDNHEHRHVSHLVGLFDGLPAEFAEDPSLRQAARRVIEERMRRRREDGGGVMSFGLVQLGQAAASLGEAELAYEAVDMLSDAYWKPNLVSTHNPQSLLNVDICGGMPAVIIKMLVASKPGSIRLLPALPEAWPAGRIEGVLCRGQIEIQSLQWDAEHVALALVSAVDQQIELEFPSSCEIVRPGTTAAKRQIRLPAGEVVTVEAVRR